MVQMEICLSEVTYMSIRNIIYSSDGNVDSVRVSMDGQHAGFFETKYLSDGGNGWNKFQSTGSWPAKAKFGIGRHTITFEATNTDEWAVEIDMMLSCFLPMTGYNTRTLCVICIALILNTTMSQEWTPYQAGGLSRSRFQLNVVSRIISKLRCTTTRPKILTSQRLCPSTKALPRTETPIIVNHITISTARTTYVNSSLTFSGTHNSVNVDIAFSFKKSTPSREIDERLMSTILFIKLRHLPNKTLQTLK
ncbi:hypothetical protein MAR_028639 [Mya arenaria]|uniref:MAM domain-containing protein n=1 Tax=Mya arenaria TaxID=6604 RepID=A0ABY7DF99_MYAAR|nr:hypothetical protein MAR_028639 [Mya arenaria]